MDRDRDGMRDKGMIRGMKSGEMESEGNRIDVSREGERGLELER